MHTQKRHRDEPKEEKANHRVRLDALRFRDAIVECQEGGPDCSDHAFDSVGSVHVLDCEPEDGKNGARYNRDVGAPEAPRCSSQDWKRCVVDDADCAVQCNHEGYDEEC